MMAQNPNVAHQWNERSWTAGQATLTIDLPADRVLHDSALIDHAITMAFDRLQYVAVELRVRETVEMARDLL